MFKRRNLLFFIFLFGCIIFLDPSKTTISAQDSDIKKITPFALSPITIDATISGKSFTIPEDGKQLYEPSLKLPAYAGFVQTLGKTSSIEKVNLESFSLNGDTSVVDARLTSDGNGYILIVQTRNDLDAQAGNPYMFNTYLVKIDLDGNISKVYNIATGSSTVSLPTNSITEGSNAMNASQIFEDNGQLWIEYIGATPNDAAAFTSRILHFNETLTSMNYFDTTFTNIDSTPGLTSDENGSNIVYDKVIKNLDNDFYRLGFYKIWTKTNIEKPTKFRVQNISIVGGTINTFLLEFPKFSSLNDDASDFDDTVQHSANITLSYLEPTSDGGYIGHGFTSELRGSASPPSSVVRIRPQQFIIKWNSSGEYQWHHTSNPNGFYVVQKNLYSQSENDLYYLKVSPTSPSELIKVDITSRDGAETVIKKYPTGTTLTIIKNENLDFDTAYDFYGFVPTMESGEFDSTKYPDGPGVVVGSMKNNFDLVSPRFMSVTDNELVYVTNLIPINNTDDFLIYGTTTSKTFSNIPKPPALSGWQAKRPNTNWDAFFGKMKKIEDFPPAIYAPETVQLDLDDADLKQELATGNQTLLNNWLITGEKNGNFLPTNNQAVRVTDTYDLSYGGLTQNDLNNRINRNPTDRTLPIDWKALGLTLVRGPQSVTYFITDTTDIKQTSVTSRLVNVVDDETDIKEKGALAASNFTIHVNDLPALLKDKDDAKKLAKVLAWDTNDIKSISKTADVAVNTTELTTIQDVKAAYDNLTQEADKSTIIKPYKLTFTWDYAGESFERVITVFVTDDTTEVDATNEVVLYAFNFRESIKKVKALTESEVVQLAHASAWNLNGTWGDLPYPKADISVNIADPVHPSDITLTGLNNVTAPRVDYKVKFTYNQTVNHKALADIYATETIVNVRQVILNANEELVVPSNGYLTFHNIDQQIPENDAAQINVKSEIMTDDTDQTFKPFKFMMHYDHWWYRVVPIKPEYYDYSGFVLTSEKPISGTLSEHQQKDKSTGFPRIDFTATDECWLTIYLEPLQVGTIKPYSWDYQQNTIGELTP